MKTRTRIALLACLLATAAACTAAELPTAASDARRSTTITPEQPTDTLKRGPVMGGSEH